MHFTLITGNYILSVTQSHNEKIYPTIRFICQRRNHNRNLIIIYNKVHINNCKYEKFYSFYVYLHHFVDGEQ